MFSLNGLGEYEAKLSGITFVCDEANADMEEKASAIARCYRERLSDIARFMLDDGIKEFFGEVSADDIIRQLGFPIISLDRNTVTYPDNGFDDMLIIEFRFKGILEGFCDLDIDG